MNEHKICTLTIQKPEGETIMTYSFSNHEAVIPVGLLCLEEGKLVLRATYLEDTVSIVQPDLDIHGDLSFSVK